MASAQVVETSVNTNNSPSQDYTTNPDDHSNHNIDSSGFKLFTIIFNNKNTILKKLTKLYMHNTLDDVIVTNISRETNYSHIFLCSIQNKSCPPFLGYVLS